MSMQTAIIIYLYVLGIPCTWGALDGHAKATPGRQAAIATLWPVSIPLFLLIGALAGLLARKPKANP